LSAFVCRHRVWRRATSVHATTFTAVLILLLAFAVLVMPLAGEAQQAGKVARIGLLRPGSPPDPFVEAFKQGLRELGYVEGQTITIEYRWAEGRDERLPGLAADLVRRKVDVIVASAPAAALAAKHATTAIPIVMPVSTDPVALGLVASLARPSGNVTGLASLTEELPGKWMELLKETIPRLSRVAILWDPASSASLLKGSEDAASSLGLRLQTLKVGRLEDLGAAFAEARKNRAEGLIVLSSSVFYTHRTRVVQLATKQRLPTMYHHKDFVVDSGGLISYGPNFHDLFRRAATYVDISKCVGRVNCSRVFAC